MGKVFTQWEVADGRIPEPGAHEQAALFIMSDLIRAYDETEVFDLSKPDEIPAFGLASGMVYGSVAMGVANRRSDLDVLLNYHPDYSAEIIPRIGEVIKTIRQRFAVPVEPNIYPVNALYDPRKHSVDPLFAEHLIAIQYQEGHPWSYGWPVDGLAYSNNRLDFSDSDRIRSIALAYVNAKRSQFARAIAHGDQINFPVLQRALELPTALGRKILAATYEEKIGDEIISGDRTQVRELLFKRLEEIEWPEVGEAAIKPLKWLLDRDEEYSSLLEQAINGEITNEEYEAWLRAIVPEAYFAAHQACLAWDNILGDDLDRRPYGKETQQLNLIDDAEVY